MRALVAVILLALGIADLGAADLPTEQGENYSTLPSGFGHRGGMLVVYDFEPGVAVRPYWLAPWRHRHYYPRTGEAPGIGRDEDMSAPSGRLKPAESFRRRWSNASAFSDEVPRRQQPLDVEPSQIPAPLK